jgi:predicted DNA-binding protein (MmcQ/YjbR family)
MNRKQLRAYLLSRPEAVEDYPFRVPVPCFKIRGKVFAFLLDDEAVARVNLKCEPTEAQFLRQMFSAVRPAYHMNKTHWNTVLLDGSIPRGEIERMIDNSWALVVRGLPKRQRLALELLYPQLLK